MNAVFRSKIDGGFIWIPLAMPAVTLLALFTAPHGTHLAWIPVGTLLFATVVVCWTFAATYYELSADQLVAHCGPFSWCVPLARVTAVHESHTMRSGPALSLDRLEIVYDGGKVLVISPADKAGFLSAIQQRANLLSKRDGLARLQGK